MPAKSWNKLLLGENKLFKIPNYLWNFSYAISRIQPKPREKNKDNRNTLTGDLDIGI